MHACLGKLRKSHAAQPMKLLIEGENRLQIILLRNRNRHDIAPHVTEMQTGIEAFLAGARISADTKLKQIKGKLCVPKFVFCDVGSDLRQHRFLCLPRSSQKEVSCKVFADHIARQFRNRISDSVADVLRSSSHELLVRNWPIAHN